MVLWAVKKSAATDLYFSPAPTEGRGFGVWLWCFNVVRARKGKWMAWYPGPLSLSPEGVYKCVCVRACVCTRICVHIARACALITI